MTMNNGDTVVLSDSDLNALTKTVEIKNTREVVIRAKTLEATDGSPFKITLNSPTGLGTFYIVVIVVSCVLVVLALIICLCVCVRVRKHRRQHS